MKILIDKESIEDLMFAYLNKDFCRAFDPGEKILNEAMKKIREDYIQATQERDGMETTE